MNDTLAVPKLEEFGETIGRLESCHTKDPSYILLEKLRESVMGAAFYMQCGLDLEITTAMEKAGMFKGARGIDRSQDNNWRSLYNHKSFEKERFEYHVKYNQCVNDVQRLMERLKAEDIEVFDEIVLNSGRDNIL